MVVVAGVAGAVVVAGDVVVVVPDDDVNLESSEGNPANDAVISSVAVSALSSSAFNFNVEGNEDGD